MYIFIYYIADVFDLLIMSLRFSCFRTGACAYDVSIKFTLAFVFVSVLTGRLTDLK